jgi:hypothetical protein
LVIGVFHTLSAGKAGQWVPGIVVPAPARCAALVPSAEAAVDARAVESAANVRAAKVSAAAARTNLVADTVVVVGRPRGERRPPREGNRARHDLIVTVGFSN